MARAVPSRENLFGGLFKKLTEKKETYRRSASKGSTLSDDARREARADLQRRRKEHLEDLRYEKEAKRLKRELAQLEAKVERAEEKIEKAEKRQRAGAITEAEGERIRKRLEGEIAKYEEGKRRAQAASKNPATSAAQYHLAQAVISGHAFKPMPLKVAREIVARTPARLRSEYSKNPRRVPGFGSQKGARKKRAAKAKSYVAGKRSKSRGTHRHFRAGRDAANPKKKGKRNPLGEAAELAAKFSGRPATKVIQTRERIHRHKNLAKLGDLARLVIDTPTGKVFVLNFNLTDPKKIVHLGVSEDRDKRTGELIGKQLYLKGGDQEPNLKAMGMDGPEWVRDFMELGRLHEFPEGSKQGSIVYRARKKFNNFKLTDWWHKTGEDSGADNEAAAALLRKYGMKQIPGPAKRPLVVYDYRNKKLNLVGGQYFVDAPGIIN